MHTMQSVVYLKKLSMHSLLFFLNCDSVSVSMFTKLLCPEDFEYPISYIALNISFVCFLV